MSRVTWMRWYVSDIIAINRLISTITDTSKYVPKIILKKPSVQSGRNCGIGLISSDVVCPNTAKNNRSNAMTGVIGPIVSCVCVCVFICGDVVWPIYFFRFEFNVANFILCVCVCEFGGSRCNTIQNEMELYIGKKYEISFDCHVTNDE